MRSIIDWNYYKERVSGTIQKIVTIPAALQKCLNPVPKIKYPDWLHKRLKANDEKFKQKDMKYFFTQKKVTDIEDTFKPVVVQPQIQKLSIKQQPSVPRENKYEKIEECP